jgi:hypothetical protein
LDGNAGYIKADDWLAEVIIAATRLRHAWSATIVARLVYRVDGNLGGSWRKRAEFLTNCVTGIIDTDDLDSLGQTSRVDWRWPIGARTEIQLNKAAAFIATRKNICGHNDVNGWIGRAWVDVGITHRDVIANLVVPEVERRAFMQFQQRFEHGALYGDVWSNRSAVAWTGAFEAIFVATTAVVVVVSDFASGGVAQNLAAVSCDFVGHRVSRDPSRPLRKSTRHSG